MDFPELGSIRLPTPMGTSSFNIRKLACHMMKKQLELKQEAFLNIPILGRAWEVIANHTKVEQLCEFRDKLVDNHGDGFMMGFQFPSWSMKLNKKDGMLHISVSRERHLSYFHWTECGDLELSIEELLDSTDPSDHWKILEPADMDSRPWKPSPDFKIESWDSWSDVWKRVDMEAGKMKVKTRNFYPLEDRWSIQEDQRVRSKTWTPLKKKKKRRRLLSLKMKLSGDNLQKKPFRCGELLYEEAKVAKETTCPKLRQINQPEFYRWCNQNQPWSKLWQSIETCWKGTIPRKKKLPK